MRTSSLAPLILLTLAACGGPAYRNAELSPEKRAKDLVARMSLEEKAGQLLCPLGWPMYVKEGDQSQNISEDAMDIYKNATSAYRGNLIM